MPDQPNTVSQQQPLAEAEPPMATAKIIDAVPPSAQGREVYQTLDIRIDREGTWFYHGSPIKRKDLICLLASTLRRDEAGGYWLVTPREMGPIDVEDAPFLAVEVFAVGAGEAQILSVRTNVDELVTIDAQHPLFVRLRPDGSETAPYIRLPGGREARLTRSVYYHLVETAEERSLGGRTVAGVYSCGIFFPLGELT